MRPRRKQQPNAEPDEKPAAKPEPPPVVVQVEHDDEEEEEDEAPARRGRRGRLQREMVWFDGLLRRWLVRFMIIGTHTSIALIACYFFVWSVGRGRSYDSVEKVPLRLCGLVLGTVPKVDGRDNLFFKTRIQAAADLYHGSKLQYLIVSGDNSRNGYDEPTEMKAALIAKGVPADRIYCDYAGFRTLDSVVRAAKIFGQTKFTIISQPFHNQRALYIARRKGLVDCVAFNAAGAATGSTLWMYARELPARIMAILDVEFLKTTPKHLGNKVEIGDKHPPVDANPLPRR